MTIRRTLRFALTLEIALVLALVGYGIVRFPAVVSLSPVESLIYLTTLALLLIAYAGYGLRQTYAAVSPAPFVLWQGLFFGLVIGLLWVIEVITGNLNFAKADWAGILYRVSTFAVLIATFVAGFRGAQHTARVSTGIQVGLWSGMISGLITFISLMLVTYVFQTNLQTIPQDFQEYLRSGAPNFATYIVSDALAGATNHLWIGPLLGIVLGALGGVIGKSLAEGTR